MSEYDDIALLFARNAQPEPNDAIVAAVREQIEAERRRAKLIAIASALALIPIAGLVRVALPPRVLEPVWLVQEHLMSMPGMLACAVGALALAARLKFADI
jgi:hypothetical protein